MTTPRVEERQVSRRGPSVLARAAGKRVTGKTAPGKMAAGKTAGAPAAVTGRTAEQGA